MTDDWSRSFPTTPPRAHADGPDGRTGGMSNLPFGARWRAILLLALALGWTAPAAGEADARPCRETERFSRTPCVGRKPIPEGVEAFLARPTRSEWQAQLDLGWGGSDGSTGAPDRVGGVPIGATSRAHGDVDLPANRHDWYYEIGRTYRLDERFRKAADDAFLAMCLERIRHVGGLRGFFARADLLGRYAILRTWGFAPWLARPGPVTPAPEPSHVAAGGK